MTEDKVHENEAAVEQPTVELEQALERYKILEEDVWIKEDILKNLETQLNTSKEMARTAKGVADSLELENPKLINSTQGQTPKWPISSKRHRM